MKIWKNTRFRRTFAAAVMACIICDIIILHYGDYRAVLAAAVCEALCIGLFTLHDLMLFRNMSELSDEVDRVLHGKEELTIENSKEGELWILSSELRKMTVRLRAQAHASEQDRQHMSKVLADISHQLRTPLTAMNLTVNLLAQDEQSETERRKHIRDLKNSLGRMENLVEALLKLARLDSGTVEFRKDVIKTGDVITKAAAPLLIPMELRDISLVTDTGDTSFAGDPEWSAEVFGNLIKNCVEHTPTGGTITVRATETPIYTEIVISDNGEGFVPSDIPHLFERFYRGENASPESVGIGLALCRDVISAQNGTIKAENIKPRGAQFTVKMYKKVL